MKKRVFISHRAVDFAGIVSTVISSLKEHEIDVWYSEEYISAGQDYASAIAEAIGASDLFLAVITDNVLKQPGQVMNEISLASSFGKKKIAIVTTGKPLPENMLYHFQLNIIKWGETTKQEALKALYNVLGTVYLKPRVDKKTANRYRENYSTMTSYTDDIFSDISHLGGYSWGTNKSVIQNLSGGWPLGKIYIEEWNEVLFDFEQTQYNQMYREYCISRECEIMDFKGKNHTRWMLTDYDSAYNQLFLAVRKTQWRQTQFVWHHLLQEKTKRKKAVNAFFEEEQPVLPNSLCLHLVLIDIDDNIVASKITRRKKDDYPGTVAITIGEQLDETDYTATDNFMIQWVRRALYEEFGLDEANISRYVDEDSARVMALDMEGDIYNFALVCCMRLKSTTQQLFEYYKMHRSSEDEFDELYPIALKEVPDILKNSKRLQNEYHPSSFIRLLYSYFYIKKELPL